MKVNFRHSKRRLIALRLTLATCAIVLLSSPCAHADLVKLMNGGEIRGRILKGPGPGRSTADSVVLETLSGITIAVARSETKFITMRQLVVDDYETKVKRIANTLEAHWELAEWCRQRSLSKQRETHLLRVVEHDPFHEKAQLGLGRVWHEGAWVNRDEMMAAQGYVPYKGRYVTIQELDLINKTANERSAESEWFQKIRLWQGWIAGTNEDKARQGMLALQAVHDPHAAPAVFRFLCEGEDVPRDMRALGVKILSKLTGSKGAKGLVKLSLYDEDNEVRYAALNGIATEDFETAQADYIKELRNSINMVVCRAGLGLGRVGDQRAIAPLIEALVTTHRYQVQSNIPVGNVYGMSTDGQVGSTSGSLPLEVEIAIRTGQLPQGATVVPLEGTPQPPRKTVTVSVDQNNPAVLSSLQKLTGQNFGYDERTWRLWWAAEKNAGGGIPATKK